MGLFAGAVFHLGRVPANQDDGKGGLSLLSGERIAFPLLVLQNTGQSGNRDDFDGFGGYGGFGRDGYPP